MEEVEVSHIEETTTTTFTVAAGDDGLPEHGIRDDIFLLNGTFIISFAAERDAVHLEVLDDVQLDVAEEVQLEVVLGIFLFIDLGLDNTAVELFGASSSATNFSILLLVQVEDVLDSVADIVQDEDFGVLDAGILIIDSLRGTETIVVP